MQLILISLGASVLFVILDLLWFQLVGNFFKAEIGNIARLDANGGWDLRIVPALLVYVLMGVGVTVFVYLNASGAWQAVLLGALFGLVGYGLYDLTNLATLSDWTVRFAVVDMLWGTFLCGAVSGLTYLIAKGVFSF